MHKQLLALLTSTFEAVLVSPNQVPPELVWSLAARGVLLAQHFVSETLTSLVP